MRTILLAVVLASAAAAGCSKDKAGTESAASDLPMMTVDEVDKGLAANTLTAVDCNGESTRKKYGILPGAILLADEEAYTASELPADKARKLVFYCSGPS